MVGCLVISHGTVAQAVVEASQRIAGVCEQVFTLSSDDVSPKQLHSNIIQLTESKSLHDGLIILVSLRGGSFWNAATRIAREYDNVKVISGLNLSMLLAFITKKDKLSFDELAKVMVADSIRGITSFRP